MEGPTPENPKASKPWQTFGPSTPHDTQRFWVAVKGTYLKLPYYGYVVKNGFCSGLGFRAWGFMKPEIMAHRK